MNVLQSYTPLSHPLSYDSLAAREGCEATSGFDQLGWRAFERICVFGHDKGSAIFNQPDTVSYFYGPEQPGQKLHPFTTHWAAWVATAGVRVGHYDKIVPPSNGLGNASAPTFYGTATPAKISAAFNDDGLLAIASQATGETWQLRRYTDATGTIATANFAGKSAVLFNNSLLDSSIKSKSGIVAFYIKSEVPNTLFARYERDADAGGNPMPYGVERIAMPDLRVKPARLISVTRAGRKQVLRYIDTDGQDVTLTSPLYITTIDVESKVGFSASLEGGFVIGQGVLQDAGLDKAKFTMALAGGLVYDAVVAPDNVLPTDTQNLTIGLEDGAVSTP